MNNIRDAIDKIELKILAILDGMLDEDMPLPAPPKPSPAVARRELANVLRLSRLCARNMCRRAGCCRGEPLECLRYALPLVPPKMLAELTDTRRQRGAAYRRALRTKSHEAHAT